MKPMFSISPQPQYRLWRCKKCRAFFILIILLFVSGTFLWHNGILHHAVNNAAANTGISTQVNDVVDSLNGVPVYHNGVVFWQSHGRHYAKNGYYYGQKWQCVEFVKRYYYDHYQHAMPNVWGHAKDFYVNTLATNTLNTDRGLQQFANDGQYPPQTGDLLVWQSSGYGHVAIISEVNAAAGYVEIVQQNIVNQPRERLRYHNQQIGINNRPVGWLRMHN